MTPKEKPLGLDRTAKALAAYDEERARFDRACGTDRSAEEMEAELDRLVAAEEAVRDAFALDTADRNSPDRARLIAVDPKRSDPRDDCWVRRLVRDWAAASKTA